METQTERPLLCLSCRSVVLVDEAHDHEGAELVDLVDREQRARAFAYMAAHELPAVLPTPEGPGWHVVVAIANSALGGLMLVGPGGLLVALTMCGSAVVFAGVALRGHRSARKLLTTAHGAAGIVTSSGALASPVTSTQCSAYHVELRLKNKPKDQLGLLYGHTSELEIRLDDGRTARVPAGSVRLTPAPRRRRFGTRASTSVWRRVVQWVDPHRRNGDDVIRYNALHERCLQVGDRVSVDCELVPAAPGGAMAGHAYRDAAPAVVAPKGLVCLGVMKR